MVSLKHQQKIICQNHQATRNIHRYSPPGLVQAPRRLTTLRWWPIWMRILSSDMRARCSLCVAPSTNRQQRRKSSMWALAEEDRCPTARTCATYPLGVIQLQPDLQARCSESHVWIIFSNSKSNSYFKCTQNVWYLKESIVKSLQSGEYIYKWNHAQIFFSYKTGFSYIRLTMLLRAWLFQSFLVRKQHHVLNILMC